MQQATCARVVAATHTHALMCLQWVPAAEEVPQGTGVFHVGGEERSIRGAWCKSHNAKFEGR